MDGTLRDSSPAVSAVRGELCSCAGIYSFGEFLLNLYAHCVDCSSLYWIWGDEEKEKDIKHVMKSTPMHVDNPDYQMGFICSDEAGEFMAFLVDKDVRGAINGSSKGTISIKEIINFRQRVLKDKE